MIPPFDLDVESGGYAWWYLDAFSDDGKYGLTLIAFIGSVFSPYYARARARGSSDPLAHCAVNVALYGPRSRWSMTERARSAVTRERDVLAIGPSTLRASGADLLIDIREWAVPIPRRIVGQVRVYPTVSNNDPIDLDPGGRHRWTPVWPDARIEVELKCPDLSWSGAGYLDHNRGSEPLEAGFESWSWARATTRQGPVVVYDLEPLRGPGRSLALHFDRDGERRELASPSPVELPRSRWGIPRPTRADDGRARIEAAWEDTPFYARSRLTTRLLGEEVTAIHESLSLRRFSAPWVQMMLPFRMPRRSS